MSEHQTSKDQPDKKPEGAQPTDPDPSGQKAGGKTSGESGPERAAKGGGPAWLALLVALVALGGIGWMLWEGQQQDRTDDALTGLRVGLGAELEQAAAERGELGARLSELAGELESLGAEVAGLADRPDPVDRIEEPLDALAEELNQVDAELRERMGRLEQRLDEVLADLEAAGGRLSQADRELARQLALIEAQALLAMGQDRLELAGDVDTARLAWARADNRLARLDDPRLGPVRRTLRRELEALEAHEPVDWADRVGRLQALAETVPDWPVRGEALREPQPAADPDAGWRQRMRQIFGRLVTVREREAAGPGPLEIETGRERMRMLLTSASLAAARGDQELLARLIESAKAEIDRLFDTEARNVARARAALAELAEPPEPDPLPQVGEARLELSRLMDESR